MEFEWEGTEITWNPAFELGFERIDDDHKGLVMGLNVLHDAITERLPMEEIAQRLDEYAALAIGHFEVEEHFMTKAGMPGIEAHKALHRDMLEQIEKLRLDCAEGRIAAFGARQIDDLKTQLSSHIFAVDIQYVSWLQAAE